MDYCAKKYYRLNSPTMIQITDLYKSFFSKDLETKVLKGISLEITEGSFVAIYGPSGSGKSTFMHQCALLDTPTSGEIHINGIQTSSLSESQKTSFRLRNFGFIFQDYAILPELSSVENTALPLLMAGYSRKEAFQKARDTLESLGLGERYKNLPSELSGGQQQRVSIARAIVGNPAILFADEPTANLDSESSEAVIEHLKEIHQDGQTIVLVTHEKEYANIADRILVLRDGMIEKDTSTLL